MQTIAGLVIIGVTGLALAAHGQGMAGSPGGPMRGAHGAGLEQRGPEGPGGPERGAEAVLRRLIRDPEFAAEAGLTGKQIETLREQVFNQREREIELRAQLEKTALEQARLLTEPTIDRGAVMQAVEETGKIRTELAKLKMEHLLTVKETLSEEQIEKIKRLAREHLRARGGRMHPGARREGARRGERHHAPADMTPEPDDG
ncbi:MAG: hypothetical protein JW951_00700 [Lentisphaerae bacterium]|nr:hypothetical protein [Lentisphaerota bacterium]